MYNRKVQKQWFWLAMISGLGALLSYLIPTQIPFNSMVNPILFIFFGFFLILFVVSLFRLINDGYSRVSTTVGTLLLTLAGCTHSIMAAMQASLRAELPDFRAAFGTDNSEALSVMVSGLSSIQIGVDFAFDLFISAGVIFWSAAFWRHTRVGKVVCIAGILIALTGFSFNLIAFPDNPGRHGLMDPGALFGAWFTVVWVWILVVYQKHVSTGKGPSSFLKTSDIH